MPSLSRRSHSYEKSHPVWQSPLLNPPDSAGSWNALSVDVARSIVQLDDDGSDEPLLSSSCWKICLILDPNSVGTTRKTWLSESLKGRIRIWWETLSFGVKQVGEKGFATSATKPAADPSLKSLAPQNVKDGLWWSLESWREKQIISCRCVWSHRNNNAPSKREIIFV